MHLYPRQTVATHATRPRGKALLLDNQELDGFEDGSFVSRAIECAKVLQSVRALTVPVKSQRKVFRTWARCTHLLPQAWSSTTIAGVDLP